MPAQIACHQTQMIAAGLVTLPVRCKDRRIQPQPLGKTRYRHLRCSLNVIENEPEPRKRAQLDS